MEGVHRRVTRSPRHLGSRLLACTTPHPVHLAHQARRCTLRRPWDPRRRAAGYPRPVVWCTTRRRRVSHHSRRGNPSSRTPRVATPCPRRLDNAPGSTCPPDRTRSKARVARLCRPGSRTCTTGTATRHVGMCQHLARWRTPLAACMARRHTWHRCHRLNSTTRRLPGPSNTPARAGAAPLDHPPSGGPTPRPAQGRRPRTQAPTYRRLLPFQPTRSRFTCPRGADLSAGLGGSTSECLVRVWAQAWLH